ncbi:MAG TPA: hypothetical protein VF499_12555 [Afipia sp.]
MRTIAVLMLIAAASPVAAESCVFGTNRPGSDVNPAKRIDPNARTMRCDQVTVTVQSRDGQHTEKRWLFTVK